jgi:hypothetical protein
MLHTHDSYGGGGHAHGSGGPSADGKLGDKSNEGAAVTTAGSKDSSKDDDLGLDKSSTGTLLLLSLWL